MILIVHRKYRLKGGEDVFLHESLLPNLKGLGIPFKLLELPSLFTENFFSSSLELLFMSLGLEKLRPSYFRIKKELSKKKYSTVLFNNFVPTVSLATPQLARVKGIKTKWWLHNARLSCANGLLFNGKTKCHECLTIGSRQAFKYSCNGSKIQSLIYAATYRHQRVFKNVSPFIDEFIAPSEYTIESVKRAFSELTDKLPEYQVIMHPIPETVPQIQKHEHLESLLKDAPKPWFLFLGRLSFEKGADIFVQLAQKNPAATYLLAGTGPLEENLKKSASANLKFLGFVNEQERNFLFSQSDALVISSRVPENAPMVIFESHPFNLPIIYPEGGGAEEMVKYLGRDACSLEKFNGQVFSKNTKSVPNYFKKNLSSIFR